MIGGKRKKEAQNKRDGQHDKEKVHKSGREEQRERETRRERERERERRGEELWRALTPPSSFALYSFTSSSVMRATSAQVEFHMSILSNISAANSSISIPSNCSTVST